MDDQNKDAYGITFFTLDLGKDILDLMASTVQPSPPSWSNMFSIAEVGPSDSKSYNFTSEEGPIYLVCRSQPPDLPIGKAGPIEVFDIYLSFDLIILSPLDILQVAQLELI